MKFFVRDFIKAYLTVYLLSLYVWLSVGACIFVQAGARDPKEETVYARWKNGPPFGESDFPIAVWLQDPKNAGKYKAVGINLYVGLWRGPTQSQLDTLREAGMPVICSQNQLGLARVDDPVIVGWMHMDEPDNAQPIVDPTTGTKGYGPPVPPNEIVAKYDEMRSRDSSRPVLLNLGQGVANDEWVGRGPDARIDDYLTYVKGCDIVSFDVYPVAGLGKPDGENYLWYVAKGVGRLMEWTRGGTIVWNCIECTHISNVEAKATPHHVRAEVWMSIIHGSRGIIYFVHEFQPRFNEDALLDDPEMREAVTEINREIRELAPVLNSDTAADGAKVVFSPGDIPIAVMEKRQKGYTYLFSVGMRNQPVRGAFTLKDFPSKAIAEVIGENRTIPVRNGTFEDDFAAYDVHLYRIRGENASVNSHQKAQ
jgi:hypothetical protein